MPTISVDTETYYSKKLKYGIRQLIGERYVGHELFDCYMVSVSDGADAWSGHPKDFNWNALHGATLLSHNRGFDNEVTDELQKRGLIPRFTPAAWHCTSNMAAYLCNRRALDNAIEYLFKVKLDKGARSDAEGKHWPKDFSAAEQKIMLEYAKGDAIWCRKLWDKFSDKWPEVERRMSNITIDQGRRGIQIDVALLNQYIMEAHDIKRKTEQVIPWMQDDPEEDWDDWKLSPTSSKCIAEQCRRVGIPCCPVKSEDEEAYDLWEATYAPKHPWILAVTSWRSINKLYKTFLTMKSRLRPDGTMPFGLLYCGAHTGRFSGTAKLNMQNMRKIPVFANELGLLETNVEKIEAAMTQHRDFLKGKASTEWPAWVRSAIDFRALFIARPGKKMIVSDLSQIEPRVLAWLSGNKAFLKLVSEGWSVYEAAARSTMGYTGPKMDKDSSFYKMVKIQVLGLGYGAGWEKFIKICADGGVDITKDDPETVEEPIRGTDGFRTVPGWGSTSKKIVAEFRANNPLVTGFWSRLGAAFQSSVGEDFVFTLPNGRKMVYGDVKCVTRIERNPETGRPDRKSEFTADIGGRRVKSYGGKLAENITQAIARDVFVEAVVRMEDKRIGTNLFSSHDEAIQECDDGVIVKDIEAEMSITPSWLPGCPIAAEAKEVKHYTK